MDNQGTIVGHVTDFSVLPAELQPTENEIIQATDEHDLDPSAVSLFTAPPTESMISDTEHDMQEQVQALEGLEKIARAIERAEGGLSPAGARAVVASLEGLSVKLRLPSKESFAKGGPSVAHYAREAVAAKAESILEKIIAFFRRWAQTVVLWVRSTVSARGRAKAALDFAQKELPTIKSIKLAPNGFQGRGMLAADFQGTNLDAHARDSARMLGTLSVQMKELMQSAGRMFVETNNSEAGILRSISETHSFKAYVDRAGTFNPQGLAGVSWTIASGVAKTYEGGDTLPGFVFHQETHDREPVTGSISKDAFAAIIRESRMALLQSEAVLNILIAYASKIGALKASVSAEVTDDKIKAKFDGGVFTCLNSLSRALRSSAMLYDRVVCAVALDCARAVKYAERG